MLAFADIIVYHVRILGKRGGFYFPRGQREGGKGERDRMGKEREVKPSFVTLKSPSLTYVHAARGGGNEL